MKTAKIIILSFASILLGSVSLSAQAACKSTDIAGTWRLFSVTGSANAAFQGVTRGTIVVKSNGAVDTALSSVILSNGFTIKFTKGQAKVTSTCKVTATTESNVGGRRVTFNVFDGKINGNKNVISAVYKRSDGDQGLGMMIK